MNGKRQRDAVGRDREVLDRRRGLQHLHVGRLAGERGRAHEPDECGAETGRGERAPTHHSLESSCVVSCATCGPSSGSTSPGEVGLVAEVHHLVQRNARVAHRVGVEVLRFLDALGERSLIDRHVLLLGHAVTWIDPVM